MIGRLAAGAVTANLHPLPRRETSAACSLGVPYPPAQRRRMKRAGSLRLGCLPDVRTRRERSRRDGRRTNRGLSRPLAGFFVWILVRSYLLTTARCDAACGGDGTERA